VRRVVRFYEATRPHVALCTERNVRCGELYPVGGAPKENYSKAGIK
jgi:hypothetical protein